MSVTDTSFNPSGKAEVDIIKQAFADLESTLQAHCPPGRRLSLALTHLEISAMFAVKSIFEA